MQQMVNALPFDMPGEQTPIPSDTVLSTRSAHVTENRLRLPMCPPPEVGAMDDISARLATTAEYEIVVVTKHQNMAA